MERLLLVVVSVLAAKSWSAAASLAGDPAAQKPLAARALQLPPWIMWAARLALSGGLLGCAPRPEVNGSALALNMQPAPPQFAASYDFELSAPVQGKACVTRPSDGRYTSIYWLRGAGLDQLTPDALTAHALGAAAFDAVKRVTDADTLVVTRVLAEGHGPDTVCATVFGRPVRLTKASATSTPNDPTNSHMDDLLRQ